MAAAQPPLTHLLSPWVHTVHQALLGAGGAWPFDDVWVFCEWKQQQPGEEVKTTGSMRMYFEMRRLSGGSLLALLIPKGTPFKYHLTGRVAIAPGLVFLTAPGAPDSFTRPWPDAQFHCAGSQKSLAAHDPVHTTVHRALPSWGEHHASRRKASVIQPSFQLLSCAWMIPLHEQLKAQGGKAMELVRSDKSIAVAVHRYKLGAYYFSINFMLRGVDVAGSPSKLRDVRESIDVYSRLFSMQSWNLSGVRLFRCVKGAYARALQGLVVGDEFTGEGLLSTAFDPEHPLWFGDVMMVITPIKGMPYLYLDGLREAYCGHGLKDDFWLVHREVLLPPGTWFRIDKKEVVKLPTSANTPTRRYIFKDIVVLHVTVKKSHATPTSS
jgi:hypothetical protein